MCCACIESFAALNDAKNWPRWFGSAPANLAISPDDSVAYVPNLEDGTVSVIDTASNTVISTVSVGTLGLGVANVAFLPDGTAYVMNFFESSVFVIGVTDSVATLA